MRSTPCKVLDAELRDFVTFLERLPLLPDHPWRMASKYLVAPSQPLDGKLENLFGDGLREPLDLC